MPQPSFDHDAHLVAIAQGDHQAFVSLYRHEAPYMLSLAKKMLGRHTDAQDAVRDAFILIWKHAESCDTSLTSARAWMYSVFRHRAMKTLREPGRMAPAAHSWTDHLPAHAPTHLQANPVYATLQNLDNAQRRPLLMAYYHGYTTRQIAAKLGCSATQVQLQIQQSLRAIYNVDQP